MLVTQIEVILESIILEATTSISLDRFIQGNRAQKQLTHTHTQCPPLDHSTEFIPTENRIVDP